MYRVVARAALAASRRSRTRPMLARRALATEAVEQKWTIEEAQKLLREELLAERAVDGQFALADPRGVVNDERGPVEILVQAYERTLGLLASGAFPDTSVYRQSVETITRRKLDAVRKAGSDVAAVENALRAIGEIGQGGLTANEGIEGAIDTAADELRTAQNVAAWKGFEPLEDAAPERQWEYFK